MPRQTIIVEAPTNATPATEDTFFRVTAGAVPSTLHRLRVSCIDTPNGALIKGRLAKMNTDGSGAVGYTPKRHDPDARAGGATVGIKNGSSASTPGTVAQVIDSFSFNDRDYYEWIATPTEDFYDTGRYAVLIQCNLASVNIRVTADIEE